MRLYSICLVGTLFFGITLQAQVPPLSQEMRESYATHIVSGRVINIEKTKEIINSDMTDNVYTITLQISKLEKGLVPSPFPTSKPLIKINYWQASIRPDDWCGPMGQSERLNMYEKVRVYLIRDAHNKYNLLEPNGFDRL